MAPRRGGSLLAPTTLLLAIVGIVMAAFPAPLPLVRAAALQRPSFVKNEDMLFDPRGNEKGYRCVQKIIVSVEDP
jgi:hypothetical protein